MRRLRWVVVAGGLLAMVGPVAAEYLEVPVPNGGSIAGRARVSGEVPRLPRQPVFKHQETCGQSIPDERLSPAADGGLRNVVIHLADVSAGKPAPREQPVVLGNIKCAFVPHVLTASVGQTLEIRNSDPFLHDAHATLGPRTLFNVAILKGRTVRRVLASPGLVRINCNVRDTWMQAYVFVAEDPYHTVTGDDGRFRLDDVPPGTYTLTFWHEILGNVDREVTVKGGELTAVDVEFQASAQRPEITPSR